jgi:TolB-like protein
MESSRPDATAEPAFKPVQLAQIREQLEKLLASPDFSSSRRKSRLLKYLVEATLAGQGAEINEYAIGLDVFERPSSFDPRMDSTVRAEMSRCRARLKEYYARIGREDPVLIDFGSRGYAASFVFRDPEVPAAGLAQAEKLDTLALEPALQRKKRFRMLAAVASAALVVLAGSLFALRTRGVSNTPVRSLVVLPFVNLSASSQNEYLADGLTEELTNELAQWQDLRVVARTSAFQFKGKSADVREIGRLLDVDAVLEGSIDRQGDRLRVTAQLNRASNGYHIWSREFEAHSADTMALQDEIARAIAAAIRGNHQSPPELSAGTANAEAHDLYLQGIYQHSLHTPDSYRKALGLFQAAIAKDPGYGSAYIGIERAEIALIHITAEQPAEGLRRAKEALEKAIDLDPHNSEAHGQIADLIYVYDWDWPRAEQQFQEAIRDGAQSTTRSYYGWALATRGRFEEAHRQFRIAQDLDPLGMGPRTNEILAYFLERKYGDAQRMLREILRRQPDALDAHIAMGLIAAMQHDCKSTADGYGWSDRKFHSTVTMVGLALSSACGGDRETARDYLKRAATGGSAFASPYNLAIGYAYLGDKERALAYLEKSAEAKEGQIFYIRYDPAFDQIRSDGQFVALEKKVGLNSP